MNNISFHEIDPHRPSQEKDAGSVMLEAALGLPFIVLLFIVLTEIGFYLMSRHSLDLAAAQAAVASTVLPLGTNGWPIGPVTAPTGPCNTNNTLTNAAAKNQLLCIAGITARNYVQGKQLNNVDLNTLMVQANMIPGVNSSVDGPQVMNLTIIISGSHHWFFGFFGTTVPVRGSKTVRYVFAPY